MPSQPSSFSIVLPYKKFIITLDIHTDSAISNFPSSTIRGGLGYALKSCVCSFHGKNCIDCILKHSCIYPFLFESIPPPGRFAEISEIYSIVSGFETPGVYIQEGQTILLLTGLKLKKNTIIPLTCF